MTRNPDGTVTVNLIKPSGIAGANQRLTAIGVRAQIAAPAKHPPKFVCPGGAAPTITFDPASIPKRQALVGGSDVLPVIRMHCPRASSWPATANASS